VDDGSIPHICNDGCAGLNDKEFTVLTEVKIKESTLRDIVITAVEGGINYWCQVEEWQPVRHPERILASRFRVDNEAVHGPSGANTYGPWMIINLQELAKAIVQRAHVMGYPIDDELSGSLDSVDADVIMQMTLLGEVVYG
jgi:hypothetical protein